MFGSIGQPVSGVKSDRTARVFVKLLQDEATERAEKQHRSKRRRQRLYRTVKGWITH